MRGAVPVTGSQKPTAKILLFAASLSFLCAAVAAAMAAGSPRPAAGAVRGGERLKLEQDRSGQPIFTISGMKPGDSASGEVTLSNTGTARRHAHPEAGLSQ